ncbi:MAG TPA: bifunctional diaminohydroxyphosphoribosylaminopyrimidine deaminase/5-amino-6-(5-phosphoribosylamino)uracil reductase RibD [Stellaceae bacterium]|nr:bifunctional diaminohydroxyphosphoribosylaminopyrimidine deaminase/5-amino-6-(5-phosphoribosylamino)uracil reductase RibD [Stellaceae bacterium]
MTVMGEARWMRAALGLARRGLGLVAPNPAVGCVLVRDGVVVGRGWTQPGGRPHAETEALAQAGEAVRGAVAYVTLEPCAHHGKTPPCAEALVAAGITSCIAAVEDPDPRVSGRGFALLRQAGIDVSVGLLADEARELNAGFFKRVVHGRPLVTLKLATSLDGRISTHGGESHWITGEPARRLSHMLRRQHDAVAVGSGTVLADDPQLNVRLAGLEAPPPLRIVVDGRLRTPLTARLVREAATTPTLVATLAGTDPLRLEALRGCGVEVAELPADSDGALDLGAFLDHLGARGLTRLLVEGGATLAASLLRHRLVDRIAWFRSPGIIGGDGRASVEAFGVERLAEQVRGTRLSVRRVGEDVLETWAAAP